MGASDKSDRATHEQSPQAVSAVPVGIPSAGEPNYTVYWLKKWDAPMCAPADCRHPCTEVLTINQRLEPKKRGGHEIHLDASICMNCGADTTGNLSLADGLRRCFDEHGWNRATGLRLYDLAEFHKDTFCAAPPEGEVWPIWFLHAWGWTGKQIVEALNKRALVPSEEAA